MKSALAAAMLIAATGTATAAPAITVVSSSGTGTFSGATSIVHDDIFPAQGAFYAGADTVSWTGTSVVLTLDFGQVFNVSDVKLSVDNNDFYQVQISQNGTQWNTLFTVLAFDGEINGGMDTMSSVAGDPEYIASIDFPQVAARYARVYAVGGDNFYSVGEMQFSGTPAVPEPGEYALMGLGLIGLGLRLRKAGQRGR